MTERAAAARTDYTLRLAERRDGRATGIDGAFIAARGPGRDEAGLQITHDIRVAMRFSDCHAARRFCSSDHATGSADGDGRLTRLLDLYAIDVIPVRRLAPEAGLKAATRTGELL